MSTTIRFSLPQRSHVTLKVFDVLGREVATLVDGEMAAGEHSVPFTAGRNSRRSVHRADERWKRGEEGLDSAGEVIATNVSSTTVPLVVVR
jgi:hypothetical protein